MMKPGDKHHLKLWSHTVGIRDIIIFQKAIRSIYSSYSFSVFCPLFPFLLGFLKNISSDLYTGICGIIIILLLLHSTYHSSRLPLLFFYIMCMPEAQLTWAAGQHACACTPNFTWNWAECTCLCAPAHCARTHMRAGPPITWLVPFSS